MTFGLEKKVETPGTHAAAVDRNDVHSGSAKGFECGSNRTWLICQVKKKSRLIISGRRVLHGAQNEMPHRNRSLLAPKDDLGA
jgi:hypothetical protein